MHAAALLVVIGVLAVAAATQLYGLRLCGAVTVPLLAVYTLRDPTTLGLFVVVTSITGGVLWLVTHRTLIYGRLLFTIPVLCAIIVSGLLGSIFSLPAETAAIGSLLPGIAAYNLYRVDDEQLFSERLLERHSCFLRLSSSVLRYPSQA